MKLAFLLAFVLSLSACAMNPTRPTDDQVISWLEDAKWGERLAVSQLWLTPADGLLFENSIDAAEALIRKMPGSAVAVTKATLKDVERFLPADARLRPYIDAILQLL